MVLQSSLQEQSQRLQVERESNPAGRGVKIRVEHYDERLGWYCAGSLSLALHQLPLLEQAIAAMRKQDASDEASFEKIIPFPGLMVQSAG